MAPSSSLHTQVDEYGTQQPIALLKLLLEKGFLYDRGKELNCKSIRDLGFIAAMGKAGGGRNEVDPRFLSLFSVFNVPFPSEISLHLIYFSILRGHTSVTGFPRRLANGLVWGRAWGDVRTQPSARCLPPTVLFGACKHVLSFKTRREMSVISPQRMHPHAAHS